MSVCGATVRQRQQRQRVRVEQAIDDIVRQRLAVREVCATITAERRLTERHSEERHSV